MAGKRNMITSIIKFLNNGCPTMLILTKEFIPDGSLALGKMEMNLSLRKISM